MCSAWWFWPHGPFAFSRNPMFLSGLTVLLGWALFYGSVVILMLAVLGWAMANLFKVPQEGRGLEALRRRLSGVQGASAALARLTAALSGTKHVPALAVLPACLNVPALCVFGADGDRRSRGKEVPPHDNEAGCRAGSRADERDAPGFCPEPSA